jgi:hypothetical protein
MELVCHHLFIAAASEDGNGIDLEELSGVNVPIILLQKIRAKHPL